jgi:hypothetical protein
MSKTEFKEVQLKFSFFSLVSNINVLYDRVFSICSFLKKKKNIIPLVHTLLKCAAHSYG